MYNKFIYIKNAITNAAKSTYLFTYKVLFNNNRRYISVVFLLHRQGKKYVFLERRLLKHSSGNQVRPVFVRG